MQDSNIEELCAALQVAPVVHLVGGRQTGKTSVLRGLAAALTQGGSSGVVLAPMRRFLAREAGLQACVKAARDVRVLLVDDVHLVPGWAEQVERLRARGMRVVAAGQHRPDGDAVRVDLAPLTFRQALRWRCPATLRGLPPPLGARGLLGDPADLRDRLWQIHRRTLSCRIRWDDHLAEFGRKGGYPGALRGPEGAADYLLSDVVERVLGIDLTERAPIEQPALLRKLLVELALRTGDEISQGELARELGAAQPLVGRYLGHLVDAGLLREIRRYPSAPGARVPSKYALVDPGLREAVLWEGSASSSDEPWAVTLLQSALRHEADLGFWRDYEKPSDRRSPIQHVSLVVQGRDDALLPLQIDREHEPGEQREAALRSFLGRFDRTLGILVTRGSFSIAPSEPVVRVPLGELMIAL